VRFELSIIVFYFLFFICLFIKQDLNRIRVFFITKEYYKMDYGFSEKRKTKNDKRAKSRYNKYKRGGALRIVKKDKSEI
jgi:hypothetical protein